MRKYFLICLFAMVTGILNAQEVKSGVAQDSLACDTVISLDGVDVVARRATVKVIGHSIVVDVEHDSILNRQNDIYEMLQKTPGIIRMGQSIMVAGKGAPIYYINGRKVREQSQLDNLQVDQVKSVQVIPTADANYEATGAPVVDIKTKKLGNGLAFNVVGNLTQAKHLAQKYGFISSYNMDKLDLFLSYYYRDSKTLSKDYYGRQVLADTLWNKQQYSENLSRTHTHNVQAGMAYRLSDRAELGLQYGGSFARDKAMGSDSLSVVPNIGKTADLLSGKDSHNHTDTHHLNAYYDAAFDHDWHLSMAADYVHKEIKNNTHIQEKEEDRADDLQYNTRSRWDVISANIHANHGLGNWGNLSFGYDFSYSKGIDGIDYARMLHSGNTDNREVKNAVFANYTLPLGAFSLSAGLRFENVTSKQTVEGEQNALHHSDNYLMPVLNLSHAAGMLMQSLSYSIETSRPNYVDMNDNVIYLNRYERKMGNAGLTTQLEHNVSYMLMYNWLYFTLNYSYLHRPLFADVYSLPGQSAVTVSRQTNLSHRQILAAMLNIRKSIGFWTPTLTGFMQKSFVHYPGVDGQMFSDKHPTVMLTFDNDFQLPKGWLLSAGYQQLFGGYLETVYLSPLSTFNLSIKKSFLQDRLRLSIDANDIFNGDKTKSSRQIHNVVTNTFSKYETRKIGLTLTYRFRKNVEKKKISSAETEMKRLQVNADE